MNDSESNPSSWAAQPKADSEPSDLSKTTSVQTCALTALLKVYRIGRSAQSDVPYVLEHVFQGKKIDSCFVVVQEIEYA
jgi:hypothetical protein